MNLNKKTRSSFYKCFAGLCAIAFMVSCSQKKNTWLSRNWHAMNSYYNILFHGNEALAIGREQVTLNYQDNYWEILPIERMKDGEDSIVYGKMVDPSKLHTLRRTPTMAPRSQAKPQQSTAPTQKSSKQSIADAFSKFNTTNRGFNRANQNSNRRGRQNNFNSPSNNFGNNRGFNQQNNSFNNNNRNNPLNNNQGFNQRNNGFNNRGNQAGFQNSRTAPSKRGGSGRRAMSQQIGNLGGGKLSNRLGQAGRLTAPSRSGGVEAGAAGSYGGRFVDGTAMNTDEAFKLAEEKAAKAIQKHNMLIQGVEHNPQMKDAFLLLGKARYYDSDFFPALEAFNYVINKYSNPEYIAVAQIWKEKTYMRMENYDRAIENLSAILNSNIPLEEDNIVQASTALAQAYLNTEQLEKAIKPLNTAIHTTQNDDQKGRYLFIKGQIFEHLNNIDSAMTAFDQVIALKRKIPRIYRMHAFVEKAKHDNLKTEKLNEVEYLKELIANRENRPYLDILYYQTAQYYKGENNMEQALSYYNQSLRTNTADHGLRYRIYKTLGEYYFNQAEYKTAGAYYDSTMVNLAENSRQYRTYRRKRLNLHDVIFYEEIAQHTDSILHLVRMSPEKRKAYFKSYTDSLKTLAIAKAKKAKKAAKRQKRTRNMFSRQQSMAGGPQQGTFYFYSPARVAAGEQTFKRIWGNRELQDNWRTEKSRSTDSNEEEEEKEEIDFMAAIENNPAFQPETYLSQIPQDPEAIDSISDVRNFAYYQLGIIYNVKFEKYQLSANKFEGLLHNKPEERLILPSKYNLYKVYKKMGNTSQALQWKQNIINEHPDSRYAKILLNPKSLRNTENNPVKVYNRLYKKYKAGLYKEVLAGTKKYANLFIGNDIVPKMELLKAMAKGRLLGYEAYREALNYVALTYPRSEEGKRAEEIIQESLPKMQNTEFAINASGSYNLLYPFAAQQRTAAESLKNAIDQAIKEYEYSQLYTSIDTYSPQKIFVVIHGLSSRKGAEGFGVKLKKDYQLNHQNFGISTENYEIILIHKNLKAYLKALKE